MPTVVVDLGADASPERIQWVLDACNAAIGAGRCVSEAPSGEAPPRAVAIVRVKDAEGRSVLIEVGTRDSAHADWSLRELRFEIRDPPRERWRSVGLALATLVGELDPSDDVEPPAPPPAPAPQSTEPSSRTAPPAPRPGEAPPDPGLEAELPQATPTRSPRRLELELPVERPRAFVGLAILAAQGSIEEPLRWGGGASGGWISAPGLFVMASADYSTVRTAGSRLRLDWLRLEAGAGYRVWASERWSLSGAVLAGARRLGADFDSDVGLRQVAAWSPLGSVRLDVWWQLVRFGGLGLSGELSSIGRSTRVLDRNGRALAEIPLGDATTFLHLWWSL